MSPRAVICMIQTGFEEMPEVNKKVGRKLTFVLEVEACCHHTDVALKVQQKLV